MNPSATPPPAKPLGAIRSVLSLIRPHRRRLQLAQLVFLLKHSPVWAMPILTADLINVVSSPDRSSPARIWRDGIILFVLILQNIPTHVLYVRLISQAARNVESDLRQQLIRRLQQLSIGFLEKKPSGALQSKLMRDVEAIQGLAQMFLMLVTSCSVGFVLSLGITAFKRPAMLLFYFVAAPIAVGMSRFFRRDIQKRNQAFRQRTENLSARVMEMINMLPLSRAHGLEDIEIHSLSEHLNEVRTHGLRVDMINAFFGAAWWCASQTMQMCCLLITIYLAWQKTIQPGDVVLYTSLFAMLVQSIGQIVDSYPGLTRGLESARSVRELLDTPEIEKYDGKAPVSAVRGAFDFQNVTFTYPGASQPAVGDFSLRVEPGETVALVGASGSGKSTLMSLIIGFRRPEQGRILLDGKDMTEIDLRTYRRHLAVVPQQTILFSGSVRDNITYGLPDVDEGQFQKVIRMARVDEFLPNLPHGLDTEVGEHGTLLSGGQRQRIAIARAIMRDPRVIILDEATSALDTVSERLVQEAIGQLVQGRTTFVVAHRLSTIRTAHRIVVMKQGRIVEVGAHDELIARGQEFARMHALS